MPYPHVDVPNEADYAPVEPFAVADTDGIYFMLNIGDGDCQVILLPKEHGARTVLVVDVGKRGKVRPLLEALTASVGGAAPILQEKFRIGLLVATHPHSDHIGGMRQLVQQYPNRIDEYWDPAFLARGQLYNNLLGTIEKHNIDAKLKDLQPIRIVHPTAGYQRFVDGALITVLSPSQGMRSRYDTIGVDTNNASIAMKVEFPVRRVAGPEATAIGVAAATSDVEKRKAQRREYAGRLYRYAESALQRIVLGADAQADAWATVVHDFPAVHENSPIGEHLKRFIDAEPLGARLFKVPHHASKNGVNVELASRIKATYSLISSTIGGGKHGFPHLLALEALREAREPTAKSGKERVRTDDGNGIHITGQRVFPPEDGDSGTCLGSIAVVLPSTGGKGTLWRFGDDVGQPVDLANARRYLP